MPGENIHRSQGSRERANDRLLNAARKEFEGSIAGNEATAQNAQIIAMTQEIAALKQKLSTIEKSIDNARGDGGIEVKWPVFTLRRQREAVDFAVFDQEVTGCLNGVPAAGVALYRVAAAEI